MAKQKLKRSQSKFQIFGKSILLSRLQIGVAALLGGVAILVLGLYIFSSINNHLIEKEVISAREANEPGYDSERQAKISTLQKLDLISSAQPDYSSKVDVCYLNHSDSGWTISSWYQDCYVRYLDLFSISISADEVMAKLDTSQDVTTLFGESETYPRCGSLYQKEYKSTLIYYDRNFSEYSGRQSCKLPRSAQSTFTVKGPIVKDKELTAQYERSFQVSDVDVSKNYIIMQSDNYYYYKSLGCGIGLLCPSPLQSPLTGFQDRSL